MQCSGCGGRECCAGRCAGLRSVGSSALRCVSGPGQPVRPPAGGLRIPLCSGGVGITGAAAAPSHASRFRDTLTHTCSLSLFHLLQVCLPATTTDARTHHTTNAHTIRNNNTLLLSSHSSPSPSRSKMRWRWSPARLAGSRAPGLRASWLFVVARLQRSPCPFSEDPGRLVTNRHANMSILRTVQGVQALQAPSVVSRALTVGRCC